MTMGDVLLFVKDESLSLESLLAGGSFYLPRSASGCWRVGRLLAWYQTERSEPQRRVKERSRLRIRVRPSCDPKARITDLSRVSMTP